MNTNAIIENRPVIVTDSGTVIEPCGKCGGTGYLPGYEHVDGARCWGCRASGVGKAHRDAETATRRFRNRDKARARRDRKRAEEAAQRAAEAVRRQAEVTAMIAARPSLAIITYIDNQIAATGREAPYGLRTDAIWKIARAYLTGDTDDVTPADLDQAEADVAAYIADVTGRTPAPEGRVTITGEVLTVKLIDGYYGSTLKMLIGDDSGYRVWGTVPAAIDPERGDRVTLTATVSPSDDDPTFGFYKRPTKAALI